VLKCWQSFLYKPHELLQLFLRGNCIEHSSARQFSGSFEMNRMSIPEPKAEHHEGRGIRSCPIFPELRPILDEAFEIFGDKSQYVVAAPQYRAAANTAMGWKNANLLTELRIEN
jgi:hypothetical protein